jgi:hypothetical protein
MSAADSGPADETIARLSPDALVESFGGSRLSGWLLVALATHVLVIGAFSLGTLRDLLDPEGAAARKAAAAKPAATAAAEAQPAAAPADGADATASAPAAAKDTPAAAAGTPAAPAAPERGTTPIERATTEAAKPGEIPQKPDDLGISIEDTNPR